MDVEQSKTAQPTKQTNGMDVEPNPYSSPNPRNTPHVLPVIQGGLVRPDNNYPVQRGGMLPQHMARPPFMPVQPFQPGFPLGTYIFMIKYFFSSLS